MKKILSLCSLMICAVILLSSCSKVEISGDTATLYYIYGDKSIQQVLTDDETDIIIGIFDGKELYSDTPSCSFNESVSILIGGTFYQIATDDCGIIKESKSSKYFDISTKERLAIEMIFASYGGTFPCP